MILNILGAIMCCSFVGANTLGSIETSQEVSFHQENKKLATYDDDNQIIALTTYELNNYTWDNLGLLCVENNEYIYNYFLGSSVEINGNDYSLNETDDYYINYNIVSFIFGAEDHNNIFTYNDDYGAFEYSLVWTLNATYYDDIKVAVEQDIEANQSASMGDVLSDFISILVSGISTLATGIATGVVDMSKSLFLTIDSGTGAITGLSTFGGLIALFAGIALAVGITTKIYLWITRLGKN